jgi:diadenosine tetraphosphate (Ap4A) HIT family hydrolase
MRPPSSKQEITAMAYDADNVFAKIVRGEIPSRKVLETEYSLAFHDVRPQAPTHVLVIPKGPYRDFDAFAAQASDREIVDWVRTAGRAAREVGAVAGGFRALVNTGRDAHQEVPHLHLHLFAGGDLGPMISRRA